MGRGKPPLHLKATRVRINGKVYRYAQLVESYRRDDGMPTQRVIANLGPRSELEIENLKAALQASRSGRAVVVETQESAAPSCEVLDNVAYLDVAVVLALVAQRCVAPDSKLAATEWFPRTALPELLGLSPDRFNNTRVHRVLAGLYDCRQARRFMAATPGCHASYEANFLTQV